MDREPLSEFGPVPALRSAFADNLREERRRVPVLPILLFCLTVLTTLVAGFFQDLEFSSATAQEAQLRLQQVWNNPLEILAGWPFALSILAILLAHEMGHYLTCRYYGIRASLPYLLPAPPFGISFGTFGALIRIRSMFLDRKQLFDVGIAGPLAGFVVLVPVLMIGVALSGAWSPQESVGPTLEFGEPLIFQLATRLLYSGDPAFIRLHPIGWAAWFGMLATSLNLLPSGQLDGGHIVYALFGARVHRWVSIATFVGLILLSLVSWPTPGYLLFAGILLVMRFRHPPPFFGNRPVGRGRWIPAGIAAIIFVLTFIPFPLRWVERLGG